MSNATPRALRIVVGGSTYTPELADGIARLGESLPVKELILVDPDLARARVVAGQSARILAAAGSDCTVEATTSLDDAAVEAVSQWQFTPTWLNGQPSPIVMTVTVNFTLQ